MSFDATHGDLIAKHQARPPRQERLIMELLHVPDTEIVWMPVTGNLKEWITMDRSTADILPELEIWNELLPMKEKINLHQVKNTETYDIKVRWINIYGEEKFLILHPKDTGAFATKDPSTIRIKKV